MNIFTFKTSLRNLMHNKVFTSINIFGFAVGIAAVLLITLYVHHELSYDRFHKNPEDIYLVKEKVFWSDKWNDLPQSTTPLAPALKQNLPEVENAGRMMRWFDLTVQYENIKFSESGVCFADASIFQIFDFPSANGDAAKALLGQNKVAISKTLADKYFADINPIGKIVRIQDQYDLEVAAVFEDLPDNSNINMNVAISYETLLLPELMGPRESENWRSFNNETFVRLVENTDPAIVNAKFQNLIETIDSPEGWEFHRPHLYPITKLHLRGNYKTINTLLAVAIFILLIASINFMNLSTSQSFSRAREIGVRKVLGSNRGQIIQQFLFESVFISFISLLLALLIVTMTLPWFKEICAKDLELQNLGAYAIPIFIVATAIIGILAGLYPAFYLSSFQPVKVIKGKIPVGRSKIPSRKWLVILQFVISSILIVGTISVVRQFNYMKSRDLGFDKEHLIYLSLESNEFRKNPDTFKQEILNHPSIASASISSRLIGSISGGYWGVSKPGQLHNYSMRTVFADDDIIKTLEASYSWINPDLQNNMSLNDGFIINQATVNSMNIDLKNDKSLILGGEGEKSILGVLDNFHVHSLYRKTEPVIISNLRLDGNGRPNQFDCRFLLVRTQPGQLKAAISHMESVWRKFDPALAFEYKFIDETLGQQYKNEERLASILGGFAVVGIVVALLGLLGLSAHDTGQRNKEIGVRKVLGASVIQIIGHLTSDFVKPVIVSLIIACPLSFLLVNNYLKEFPYRISFSFSLYAIATLILVVVSLLVVSIQTLKAASRNPSLTLRDE